MITVNGLPVKVIAVDLERNEATVQWECGRVRALPIWKLRGTEGGIHEVMQLCRRIDEGWQSSKHRCATDSRLNIPDLTSLSAWNHRVQPITTSASVGHV